jgi:hypothetical protein
MGILRIAAAISAVAIILSPAYDATAARPTPVEPPIAEIITLVENLALQPGVQVYLDAIPVGSFKELNFLISASSGNSALMEFVFLAAPGQIYDGSSPAGARGSCSISSNVIQNCNFTSTTVGSAVPVQGPYLAARIISGSATTVTVKIFAK